MATRKRLTNAQKRTSKASSRVQIARDADVKKMTVKQLKLYIANEGKRLNQQLVEIQKRGLQRESFAYSKLVDTPRYAEYLGLSKSGRVKVNLAIRGKSRGEMQRVAGLIQKFANTKTITVTGIKSYYESVFNKLRSNYDGFGKLTDEQLADILKTEGFAHAKAVLGSDTLFNIIHENASVDFMTQYLENVGALQSKYAMRKELKNLKATFQPVPAGVVTPFDISK